MRLPFISDWFDNWIERHMMVANSIVTNHKKTYVLPNRFGYLLLLIVLLMMIASTNYQNSLAFMLTFMLIAIGINTLHITYKNLLNLKVRVLPTKAIFLGQQLHLPIQISSTVDQDHLSVGLGNKIGVQHVLDIMSDGQIDTEVTVKPEQRGWFTPDRFYLVTSYPFGVLRVWTWFRCEQRYLVYPKPIKPPFDINELGHVSESNSNDQRQGQEDFYSIRDYQPGDLMRNIHWRAYAREQGLVTKVYSESAGQLATFDYQMFDPYDAYNRVDLRLSWLCYLIMEASKQQIPFGLTLPDRIIEPDISPAHLEECLKALALYGLPEMAEK